MLTGTGMLFFVFDKLRLVNMAAGFAPFIVAVGQEMRSERTRHGLCKQTRCSGIVQARDAFIDGKTFMRKYKMLKQPDLLLNGMHLYGAITMEE